jgi:hypothetical protein
MPRPSHSFRFTSAVYKLPVSCSDCNKTWIFATDFWKKVSHASDFIKIRPEKAELFYADGRTDMMKPIVAFRNVADLPPKKFF